MDLEIEWKKNQEKKLFQIKEKKNIKKKLKFKKKYRIKKINKKNIKNKNYKFIIIKYNNNNLNYPRLIIIIKKKYIKLSTFRNKIKRIIRETFRIKQYKIKKLDYLIIVKKNIIFLNKNKIFNYLKKKWKKYYI